jgi:hypothetical protein
MFNDYTGKILFEARYRDLLKEAEGGGRLKAGRANQPWRLNRKLALAIAGAVLAGLLIIRLSQSY